MKSICILRFLGAAEGCLQLLYILKAKHIVIEDTGKTACIVVKNYQIKRTTAVFHQVTKTESFAS